MCNMAVFRFLKKYRFLTKLSNVSPPGSPLRTNASWSVPTATCQMPDGQKPRVGMSVLGIDRAITCDTVSRKTDNESLLKANSSGTNRKQIGGVQKADPQANRRRVNLSHQNLNCHTCSSKSSTYIRDCFWALKTDHIFLYSYLYFSMSFFSYDNNIVFNVAIDFNYTYMRPMPTYIYAWQWPTRKIIGYLSHCTRLNIVFSN